MFHKTHLSLTGTVLLEVLAGGVISNHKDLLLRPTGEIRLDWTELSMCPFIIFKKSSHDPCNMYNVIAKRTQTNMFVHHSINRSFVMCQF